MKFGSTIRFQPERYKRLSGAVLSGPYSGVCICDATQHQAMLGVPFRPDGAFPFVGAPATELTERKPWALWGEIPGPPSRGEIVFNNNNCANPREAGKPKDLDGSFL